MVGVYRDVFEQSLLLSRGANKPWNFVASTSAELLIVSLVVLVPLAYNDHLPDFHWKIITMRPAPEPLPVKVLPSKSPASTNALSAGQASRPMFHLDPGTSSHSVQTTIIPTDAPPSIGVAVTGDGPSATGRFLSATPALPPPPKPLTRPDTSSAPIKVGGSVQMAKLIRKVIPVYPALARSIRISGVVHLIGTIAKDGTIRNLQLVNGHPMLAQAAISAVEQWVYEPTLLNGEPVEVIAPIEVSFTLGP